MKMKTQNTETYGDTAKAVVVCVLRCSVLRGKFIAVNTYINIYIKKGNLKINNLIFNFKVLEKKSKLNSKQAVGMK